ncbi:helix-turn-helix domain-containing protein [Clostridium colicanis]|nr:helix-turn-helix domain-containing protein [Clostridium colicanis]
MRDFKMIQNEVLDLNLSGQAFKLYCILKSYCFDDKTSYFPSQKT